jgi:hypothetical protein
LARDAGKVVALGCPASHGSDVDWVRFIAETPDPLR